MARLPRVVIPVYPHHITQRGNRNQNVFFSKNDKWLYLELLKKEASKAGIAFWAYCLMDNHVHLIAVPGKKESLAKGIGETHKKYSRTINSRNDWKGYLWQGRFFSCPLDEGHLYAAVRYVERNPVRAGIVERAEDYCWSSARVHVFGDKDDLLSDNFLISEIPNWESFLREETNETDKRLFRSHARTGRPLGDNKFIDKLEKMTGRSLRRKKPGPKKHK